jgi:hypothetical protein
MDPDALALHQVHPAKLAVDVTAGLVSDWLMWRRNVAKALVAAFLPAVIASAILVRRDMSSIRRTRRGRYVLEHMPPSAQAVRMLGQIVVWYSAYRRRPVGILTGHVIVGVGWSHGLVARFAARNVVAPGVRRGPTADRGRMGP